MNGNLSNVVNPYLTDVGVGLVFGLGYYLIKYLYGDNKGNSKNSKAHTSESGLTWETAKSIEDFNYLIKNTDEHPTEAILDRLCFFVCCRSRKFKQPPAQSALH